MTPAHDLFVRLNADGNVLSRRSFLQASAALAAGSGLGWMATVKSQADELRKQGMACILLFMNGGPSQFETFDPKPGASTGGETKAIDTDVSGIKIADPWPKVAQQMKNIAVIRSVTGREGNHERAQFLLHTGYQPSGSVKYPHFGSIVAKENGDEKFELPRFVCVGGRAQAGAGFLGMQVAPYLVRNPNDMPLNSQLPRGTTPAMLKRRLKLMGKLEEDFSQAGGGQLVSEHRALNETAARMSLSPKLKAFDLSQEKASVRDRYGRTTFGQGCLLARRLVETGVTFVEVVSNGWDTHRENYTGVKNLANSVDPGYAALIQDLAERGMLERTLVIWMGEFGRTPRINGNKGRDHWPRSFSVALSGGGVKGGQVIGKTDASGSGVSQRPVTVPDLFCSVYQALKINPRRTNQAEGRPIRLIEGGTPVKELFS